MKISALVILLLTCAALAFSYPLSQEGYEDIPKLVSLSSLVCEGEVVDAPEPITVAKPLLMNTVATVHVDRCFKGDAEGTIKVLSDGQLPPGGLSGGWRPLVLATGDYNLFFLKPRDDKYAPVDQRYGFMRASREMHPPSLASDPLLALEYDLEAGLHDSDPELVLQIIGMLGNMKHLHSTRQLHVLLDSADLLQKTYLWEALLKVNDFSVLPAVKEFFRTQPEPPKELFMPRDRLFLMQGRLIYAIGSIRDPAALPYLEQFAVAPKQRLRMEALQALRAISNPHSVPAFLKELDDEDPDNAFGAMQGLLTLAGGGAIDWVPSWDDFDRAPAFYAAKCREWWLAEGRRKMLAAPPN